MTYVSNTCPATRISFFSSVIAKTCPSAPEIQSDVSAAPLTAFSAAVASVKPTSPAALFSPPFSVAAVSLPPCCCGFSANTLTFSPPRSACILFAISRASSSSPRGSLKEIIRGLPSSFSIWSMYSIIRLASVRLVPALCFSFSRYASSTPAMPRGSLPAAARSLFSAARRALFSAFSVLSAAAESDSFCAVGTFIRPALYMAFFTARFTIL